VIVVVLALYFTVRVQDLMSRDALQYVFTPTYQSGMFLVEIVLGVLLPIGLLLSEKIRSSRRGLFYSAVLVLLGFVAHRMNTAITSMERWPDRLYVPSVQEFCLTLGLAAFGFTAFAFVARYFNVFGEAPHHAAEVPEKQGAGLSPVPSK
jgi:Ni/Fe-hydrogenase subunit HybB-like protein